MNELSKLEKGIMIIISIISVLAILFGFSMAITILFQFNNLQMAITSGLPLIVIGSLSLYFLKKKKA